MSNKQGSPAVAVRDVFPDLHHQAATYPVRAGEDAWTAEELEGVASVLMRESARLAAELDESDRQLSEFMRNSGEGAGDDQADHGASAVEREHELSMANSLRDLHRQTVTALDRMRDGTYGACEVCSGPIGKARLEAFPRATMCVRCKEREERR